MNQGIQEWTKLNLWKTLFKNFEVILSAITSTNQIQLTNYMPLVFSDTPENIRKPLVF